MTTETHRKGMKRSRRGKARQEDIRTLLQAFQKTSVTKLYKDRESFLADLKKLEGVRNVRLGHASGRHPGGAAGT